MTKALPTAAPAFSSSSGTQLTPHVGCSPGLLVLRFPSYLKIIKLAWAATADAELSRISSYQHPGLANLHFQFKRLPLLSPHFLHTHTHFSDAATPWLEITQPWAAVLQINKFYFWKWTQPECKARTASRIPLIQISPPGLEF